MNDTEFITHIIGEIAAYAREKVIVLMKRLREWHKIYVIFY